MVVTIIWMWRNPESSSGSCEFSYVDMLKILTEGMMQRQIDTHVG